jgi:hypothetical protein
MLGGIEDRSIFLSTALAGRREWRLAAVVVFASLLIFGAAAPFARIPWPVTRSLTTTADS